MAIPPRRLGAIPSPHDHRDYRLARITATKSHFPEQYIYENLVPSPYDQGDSEACVAYSLKAIKEMQEMKERKRFTPFSAAYIYGARDKDDYRGEGMIPREALDILRNRGDCRDALMPGIGTYAQCAGKITPAIDRDAAPQKIQTYTAIHTVDEVKTSLLELGPITIGLPVYDSFYQGGHLPMPDPAKETLHGFHMVTAVGWMKDNRWLILNSWGESWGELKGYCTIPYAYPVHEMWALTDKTGDISNTYHLTLRQSMSSKRWFIYFTDGFRSREEAAARIIKPLQEDLNQLGKVLQMKEK